MSGPAPYHRPDFDWDKSLAAAQELVEFSRELESKMAAISRIRDRALGSWSGPWGEEFKKRAEEEDQNIATTAARLRGDADYWGMVWQQAAIQMNNVVYAEAVMEERDRVKIEKDAAERRREERTHRSLLPGFSHIVEGVADVGDYFLDKDPLAVALENVPGPPDRAPRPRGDGFGVGAGTFAHYSVGGDTVGLRYGNRPPGRGAKTVDRKDFDDANADSGHQADGQEEEPAAANEDPVAVDASRASLGEDTGYCTINLDLIDEYLAEFVAADFGPTVASIHDRFANGLTPAIAAALSSCPDYQVPDNGSRTVQLYLSFLATNVAGVLAVRNEVGVDMSGTVPLSNEEIGMVLAAHQLDEPPGVISVSDPEFKGVPPNSGMTDDPICAANGNFVHQEEDLTLPGFAEAISVRRTYNATALDVGLFGRGWTSTLDMRLLADGSDRSASVQVRLDDGARITFRSEGAGGYLPHHARRLSVARIDEGWRLRQGFDIEWFFSTDGSLVGGRRENARWSLARDGDSIVVSEQLSGRSIDYRVVDGLIDKAVSSDGRRVGYAYDGADCVAADRPIGDTTYEIGDDGRIAAVFDGDGVLAARNTYDRWGRVTSQLSPFGRTSRYHYGEHGTTRIFDDQGGPTNTMTHDPAGNLIAMVGGDGGAMRMTWDERNRMSTVRDRRGLASSFRYHPDPSRDLLLESTRPDGASEVRQWDELDRLVEVIDAGGGRYGFTYDGRSRLPSTVEDPEGGLTTFVRDERDLTTAVTDGDGVVTNYDWDADGQLTAIIGATGRGARLRYDAAGELVEVIGPGGETSRFEVDDGGRTTAITEPGSGRVTIEYSAAGRPLRCRNSSGDVVWSVRYGPHGLADQMTDGEGATVGYRYDIFGNRTEMVMPDGESYRFDHDPLGQLIKVRFGDEGTSTQEFDANGNVVAVTDSDGLTIAREVDRLDRTTTITQPSGATTSYTYHPLGQPATVTAPDGSVFRYEIDRVGRVVSVTGPDGARHGFGYTPGGRLSARTTAEGRRTSFRYDEAGHLAEIEGPDGVVTAFADQDGSVTLTQGDEFVTFSLDDAGRISGWANTETGVEGRMGWDAGPRWSNSTVSVATGETAPALAEMDQRGFVARVTDPAGVVTALEHDLRGRIIGQETDGRATEYAYNAMGKVTSVSDSLGHAIEMQYSPAGRLLSVQAGDEELTVTRDEGGVVTAIGSGADGLDLVTFEQNLRGLITSTTTGSGTAEVAYDGYGVIRSVSDINGRTTTYQRDRDGLVTAIGGGEEPAVEIIRSSSGAVVGYRSGDVEASEPSLDAGPGRRDTGGRMIVDGEGRTNRYDRAGRLVESLTTDGQRFAFRYSRSGQLAWDSTPSGGEREFHYNPSGQLEEIRRGDASTRYRYDEQGRRTGERAPDGSETTYVWNSLDQLTEVVTVDGAGRRSSRALHYSGLGRVERVDDVSIGWDDVVSCKPVRIGERRFFRSGMQVREISADGHWNRGEVADPFGRTDSSEGVDLGYRGELTVDGLVVMGARIYDPNSRAFLSRDPLPAALGHTGAHDPYGYAYGDPINFVDPTGGRPISIEDFGDWKRTHSQSRVGAFAQAIVDDPWGTLAMAVVVTAAVVMIATGVGTGIGVAILIGVAFTMAEGMHSKSFSPRKAAINGVISGVAAGVAGPLAGKVGSTVTSKLAGHTSQRLVAWAPHAGKAATAMTEGGVSNFIEGTAGTFGEQLIDDRGNFTLSELDAGEAFKNGLISGTTGTASGMVSTSFNVGLHTNGVADTRLVRATVSGTTDFVVTAGSGVVVDGEADLWASAKQGMLGFASDYVVESIPVPVPPDGDRPLGQGIDPDGRQPRSDFGDFDDRRLPGELGDVGDRRTPAELGDIGDRGTPREFGDAGDRRTPREFGDVDDRRLPTEVGGGAERVPQGRDLGADDADRPVRRPDSDRPDGDRADGGRPDRVRSGDDRPGDVVADDGAGAGRRRDIGDDDARSGGDRTSDGDVRSDASGRDVRPDDGTRRQDPSDGDRSSDDDGPRRDRDPEARRYEDDQRGDDQRRDDQPADRRPEDARSEDQDRAGLDPVDGDSATTEPTIESATESAAGPATGPEVDFVSGLTDGVPASELDGVTRAPTGETSYQHVETGGYLDPDDVAAIKYDYSAEQHFRELNQGLRGGTDLAADGELADRIRAVEAARQKLPIHDGDALYRVTHLPDDVVNSLIRGDDFSDDAFLSSSTVRAEATKFKGPHLLIIESSSTGRVLGDQAVYAYESEVLFGPRAEFENLGTSVYYDEAAGQTYQVFRLREMEVGSHE